MGIIHELENVQRRATKLIPSLQNLLYSERLQNLNLPSLSYRRNCMDRGGSRLLKRGGHNQTCHHC